MQCIQSIGLLPAAVRVLAIAAVLSVGLPSIDASESLTPLGRETTDRQGDLQRRLLESGMAAIAEQICRQKLADAKPGSDESATWTIRLSNAMLQRGIEQRPIDPSIWNRSSELLDGWLVGYETSRRADWIRLARAMVDFRRSQTATLSVLASPESSPLRQAALAAIRDCEDRLTQLADALQETIPLADLKRDDRLAPAAELRVVQGTVQRQLVRTLLARADLYPPDSDDALAAAADAAAQAETLLRKTPADDPSFGDVVRLLAESWLRVGDTHKATLALRPLLPANESEEGDPTPSTATASIWDIVPETGAMLVRIAIAEGKRSEAQQWLDAYYSPNDYTKTVRTAPPTLDLARLEFLLSGKNPDVQSAADWAEAIEARHGAFYGRTASLRLIDLGDSDAGSDPRVMATAAAAMLRRGEFAAAAGQYAEAANREAKGGEAESAFQHRLQAGAAYRKAGDLDAASQQLAQAGEGLTSHRLAQAAHLQAAFLLVEAGWPGDSPRQRRYQKLLETQLRLWPEGAQTPQARQMLSQLFENRQAWADAARLWTLAAGDSTRTASLWRKALRSAKEPDQQADLLQEAVAQLPADGEQALLIAMWGDRTRLLKFGWDALNQQLDQAEFPAADKARFAAALAQLRLGKTSTLDLDFLSANPDEPWPLDLIERLGRDAQQHSVDRKRLGTVIVAIANRIAGETRSLPDQLAILKAMVASEQSNRAMEVIGQFPEPRSGSLARELAQMLLHSDVPDDRRQGIERMLQYGRGMKKGSDDWFAVQLEICQAYLTVNDSQAAAKLANYLLLTSPPSDPQQLSRLREFAQAN
ncbi:hypothetical protein [Rosistilla oblonga]|uniref:hypothetical protein n=1 Tax=Rosistilla oblonga TaxID=2527990 RepID=UPI003A97BAB5